MSKRNSDTADLASPREIRADPWSTSMSYSEVQHSVPVSTPVTSTAASSNQDIIAPNAPSFSNSNQSWTTATAPPMPESDSGTRWYTAGSFIPMSDIDLQVLHTQVFKRASRGFGDQTEHQLQIVGQCQHRIQRTRRPEFFFHGFLGHVRDWEGQPSDAWREANRISNYWRRFFRIPEVPYEESGVWYPQQDNWQESNDDVTDTQEQDHPAEDSMSMTAEPGVHDTPVPIQIHQLAPTLYNILIQDEEFNAPVLEKLRVDPNNVPNASLTAWSADDLAHLTSHLSITANQLAQAARAAQGGGSNLSEDDDDTL